MHEQVFQGVELQNTHGFVELFGEKRVQHSKSALERCSAHRSVTAPIQTETNSIPKTRKLHTRASGRDLRQGPAPGCASHARFGPAARLGAGGPSSTEACLEPKTSQHFPNVHPIQHLTELGDIVMEHVWPFVKDLCQVMW